MGYTSAMVFRCDHEGCEERMLTYHGSCRKMRTIWLEKEGWGLKVVRIDDVPREQHFCPKHHIPKEKRAKRELGPDEFTWPAYLRLELSNTYKRRHGEKPTEHRNAQYVVTGRHKSLETARKKQKGDEIIVQVPNNDWSHRHQLGVRFDERHIEQFRIDDE